MSRDKLGGHISEGSLQSIAVDDGAPNEVARAARDRSQALRQQAARAALSRSQRQVTQAKVQQNDLLQRFAMRGEDCLLHLGLDLFREFIDTLLRFGQR